MLYLRVIKSMYVIDSVNSTFLIHSVVHMHVQHVFFDIYPKSMSTHFSCYIIILEMIKSKMINHMVITTLIVQLNKSIKSMLYPLNRAQKTQQTTFNKVPYILKLY